MNNYELSRDRAQAFFLSFSQQNILDTWHLEADADWLYVNFLGRPYRIQRSTGTVEVLPEGRQAGFQEVLAIFDLLCHEGTGKYVSGKFAPVNSLKNRPRAIGVGTDFHTQTAALFEKDSEGFRDACLALGGEPVPMGDLGFRFHVFGPLDVILKYYGSDEDFPASVTLLWDEQTLQYIYYETVFYIAGFLFHSILEEMKQH